MLIETPSQYFILRKFFSVAELSLMAQVTPQQIRNAGTSRQGKPIIRRAAHEAVRRFQHAALEQTDPNAREFYLFLAHIMYSLRERDVD